MDMAKSEKKNRHFISVGYSEIKEEMKFARLEWNLWE
jgi:hypothetical protein